MSKIASAFEKGKAFIAFITCGDPDLETTAAVVRAAVENGADLIELGIRKNFGVTVVAVTLPDPSDGDNPQVDVSPAPGRKFSFGERMTLIGDDAAIDRCIKVLGNK